MFRCTEDRRERESTARAAGCNIMSSRPEGIVVPIRDSEESVHILPEDLPDYTTEDAADEITSVLQAELAPLH
eukprot:24865-Eustigmatos_ZCMA.PRE.1